MTFVEFLAESIRSAAATMSATAARPAAVLWPDAEAQWADVIEPLQALMPGLVVLGDFDPSKRQGPAIWLKCAVAGMVENVRVRPGSPAVIYLPGISRQELRAIESCRRDLQPIAELQYRGIYWSQVNAKDWTLSAFLAAKKGGIGCEVAQDRATSDALRRTAKARVLLNVDVVELRSRPVNAEWLNTLLAPHPARDVLVWLNDPAEAESSWDSARWELFTARCKSDFGFDPKADGVLTGAEKLVAKVGAWSAVWELYRDLYARFPKIAARLREIKPPAGRGLFDDVSGYPQANDSAESELRYQLSAMGAMAPAQAREAILAAEKKHAERRHWLWSTMGHAPLAQALQHLAVAASGASQIPSGSTVGQMAVSYRNSGWHVDRSAIRALASATNKADTDAVGSALKAVYVPWLDDSARRFQELARNEGGLEVGGPASIEPKDGLCVFFVDGLRYDAAVDLQAKLERLGSVELGANWTTIPSVTASGKAWASPVAADVAGKKADLEFEPSVASSGKPLHAHNFRKLLAERGFQVLDKHDTGDSKGWCWVECGDLDHYGHEHGLRLARDMSSQLDAVTERIQELKDAGWSQFRIVTDHGWLLVPGGLPKSELSKFEAETRWGRCAVLKDTAHGTPLTFGWDWCKDVQIAMAPGISSFIAGVEYAHGGLSLQECLVPTLDLRVKAAAAAASKIEIARIVWKGLRCSVEFVSAGPGLSVDIRTSAALPASSRVAKVKEVVDGRASVAIQDDSFVGTAAFVVVLAADGSLLHKVSTTIGEGS